MILTHLALFSFFNGAGGPAVIVVTGGGGKRKRKRKVIRYSELDEYERAEALRAIAVKPFTPIEQAAANIVDAPEDEQEDDILILAAISRILH